MATSDQFTVESHDIFFTPTEIEVPSDTEVTILLPNLGAAPHNFSIDELDISVDIAPGETKEVKITAPEGEYEYYCNVPGHKEAGMVGTLISRPMASADEPATADEDAAADAGPGHRRKRLARRRTPATAQNVTAFDIYFEPKEITIPANTDVPFTLPNDGAAPHNFSIDELGISIDLAPGSTEETVINAPPGDLRVLLQRSWPQRSRHGRYADRRVADAERHMISNNLAGDFGVLADTVEVVDRGDHDHRRHLPHVCGPEMGGPRRRTAARGQPGTQWRGAALRAKQPARVIGAASNSRIPSVGEESRRHVWLR